MSAELRFQEFVTSGAFTLTLTRQQVAQLSMLAQGQEIFGAAALFRKGLADEAQRPDIGPDHVQYRATPAGLLVAALCHRAGLTNGGENALAEEVARCQAEVDRVHESMAQLRKNASAAFARASNRAAENEELKRRVAALEAELDLVKRGVRLKPEFDDGPYVATPKISLRDPLPDQSDAGIAAALDEVPG
jgi:hypothetical protein